MHIEMNKQANDENHDPVLQNPSNVTGWKSDVLFYGIRPVLLVPYTIYVDVIFHDVDIFYIFNN